MPKDPTIGWRWSSIFSMGALPGNSEEARAFLQRRVALFAKLIVAILGGAYVLIVVGAALFGNPGRELVHPVRLLHLSLVVIFVVVFLALRAGRRSLGTLAAVDAASTLFICTVLAVACGTVPVARNPTVGFVLVLTYTLAARAATVPSTPSRTLALGVLGSIPLVVVTYLANRAASFIPPFVGSPVGASLAAAVWLVATIGLTTAISHIIYGLHRQIERAEQLGQYTLEEKIGEGGMGIVYRASHAMLRRPTAIKLLPLERAGERTLSRFEREVQLTAKLTHPNTIAIYDYGRTPDGVFYYAMELLDGVDLEQLVRVDGPQPPGRVVHVLKQVAAALAEAHGIGLIHRDIKPANIILCERGGSPDFVKVVDFGLVKETEAQTNLSQSNVQQLVGTPYYMPPEAITAPESLDGRADIYAVGAVGYFLLTGVPVFDGSTLLEIYARHLHERPQPPSQRSSRPIPAALEAVVLACLEKDPGLRPPNATALASLLAALADCPWSDEQARVWWRERAALVRAKVGQPVEPPMLLRTTM